MVTLYKYIPAWGLPDISPFCIKVETYLRMVGVPFTTVIADSRKAPKGKLPYVDDGGTRVADSRDIIAHFEAKVPSPLDADLSREERALSTAFRGLVEEELYFYALCQRWQLDVGWHRYVPVLRQYVAAVGVPALIVPLLLRMVRRQVVRSARGQGAARHTPEELDARMCEIIDALSVQLGDKPYFLGSKPRTVDATMHAFLWSMLDAPLPTRAFEYGSSLQNLRAYCDRMKRSYFADEVRIAPQGEPPNGSVAMPTGAVQP